MFGQGSQVFGWDDWEGEARDAPRPEQNFCASRKNFDWSGCLATYLRHFSLSVFGFFCLFFQEICDSIWETTLKNPCFDLVFTVSLSYLTKKIFLKRHFFKNSRRSLKKSSKTVRNPKKTLKIENPRQNL